MAVEPITTTPVAPAPGPAPAAAAPATEPVAAPPPVAAEPAPASPTPASASAAPAPAASAEKPAEPTPLPDQTAASVPTLLEKFDKEKADAEAAKTAPAAAPAKAEAAPAKPAEEAKPGEPPPGKATELAPPAAPAPVEYKYTLPETIQMDDTLKGEVHSAFDRFRANPTEGAQELINLHEKQMQQFAQHMASEQQRIFKETRAEWAKQILSDPEIGGSGHQTAMGAIARMRDLLVAEKDRPAFDEFLRVTGAGDHPQFMKLLHNAARFYDEPTLPPPNPRPAPGNGQRPSRRLRDIYDHPRSTAEGRS